MLSADLSSCCLHSPDSSPVCHLQEGDASPDPGDSESRLWAAAESPAPGLARSLSSDTASGERLIRAHQLLSNARSEWSLVLVTPVSAVTRQRTGNSRRISRTRKQENCKRGAHCSSHFFTQYRIRSQHGNCGSPEARQ